jgi:hypothetical protein
MQLRYLAMAVLPEIPPPKRSDESMHLRQGDVGAVDHPGRSTRR